MFPHPHPIVVRPTAPRFLLTLAAALLLAGCASQPVKNEPKMTSFWPPAPDEPRIQFLHSYTQSTDVGGGWPEAGHLGFVLDGLRGAAGEEESRGQGEEESGAGGTDDDGVWVGEHGIRRARERELAELLQRTR